MAPQTSLAGIANETLYVRNLDEKINKLELKQLLYLLFSQHGRVVDVVCLKTIKMRGQAHIAFQDTNDATAAMRALQGFELNEKPMTIEYARTKSRRVLELSGIFSLDSPQAKALNAQLQGMASSAEDSLKRKADDEAEDGGGDAKKVAIEHGEEDANDGSGSDMELGDD